MKDVSYSLVNVLLADRAFSDMGHMRKQDLQWAALQEFYGTL